jgi:sugar lactone lactonase YvrE
LDERPKRAVNVPLVRRGQSVPTSNALTVLASGLMFPEGPRWHNGQLWISDMHGLEVLRVDASGNASAVIAVPESPSGLGWLPDGRLLVVSMHDRKVMRLDEDTLVEHADLSQVATWHCNDMVVDRQGRAYVSNFGDDTPPGVRVTPGKIARVGVDGFVSVAADGMEFANGMAITPDGHMFFVAETRSEPPRISAFDINADGWLSNRRVVIEFTDAAPDGICLDAEGGLWVASPFTNEALRVLDGRVVARVSTGDQGCYAVALGGADGRTLFVCTSGSWIPEEARELRSGRVSTLQVDVPAAA